MNQSNAVAAIPAAQPFSLAPRNFDEAWRLAEILAASDMVPKQYRSKPGDCLIAMQWGMEIGLKPLQALQNIAPINGKPNLYGDAGKALLLSHGCIIEEDDAEVVKANARASCTITRPGRPPVRRTFSQDDAKTAGLWGKEGPWRAYPWRQMAWRAFWFAARDAAADLLRGMGGLEEGVDAPIEKHMGAADVVQPPSAPSAPPLLDYSEADFERNLPRWRDLVASGRKTGDALLAMLSTKASFSEEQRTQILALDKKPEPPAGPTADAATDDFVADMTAAEGAAQ